MEFLKRSWKQVSAIIGAILIIGSLLGGAFAVDDRYAKAEYVSEVEERLDIKIIQDFIFVFPLKFFTRNI